jgi:hypothetical protein
MSPFGWEVAKGAIVTTAKVSEPLSKWELMQEAIERKRLLAMDEAFCASLIAAIKRGEEREPNGEQLSS